jgi:hypothetical protein
MRASGSNTEMGNGAGRSRRIADKITANPEEKWTENIRECRAGRNLLTLVSCTISHKEDDYILFRNGGGAGV